MKPSLHWQATIATLQWRAFALAEIDLEPPHDEVFAFAMELRAERKRLMQALARTRLS